MGICNGVQSQADVSQLEADEKIGHITIEKQMKMTAVQNNQLQKLLLLGSGSSGKSTLFRQLKCVYKNGFLHHELQEAIPIIRRNCVFGLITLLKKCQTLYEMDPISNKNCYLNEVDTDVFKKIQNVMLFANETFESFESNFEDYEYNNNSPTTNKELLHSQQTLEILGQYIEDIWTLPPVQETYRKRKQYLYSLEDNMKYWYSKLPLVFSWNYTPTQEDILMCRIRTTGVIHDEYETKAGNQFTITDVGGQRNERRKWIHAFDDVTAVIFVAALNHYASVLFEDESKNGMIESIEVFFDICNNKCFKRTEMILFLNKDDLFREYILTDIPLSICFNEANGCIFKKEYDFDTNYHLVCPKLYTKQANERRNRKVTDTTSTSNMQISNSSPGTYATINTNDSNGGTMDTMDDVQSAIVIGSETNEKNVCTQELLSDENSSAIPVTLVASMEDIIDNPTVVQPPFVGKNIGVDDISMDTKVYNRKCGVYPKPDLRWSMHDTYANGAWVDRSHEEWFDFLYFDYLNFITENYLSKNLNRMMKRVFVHVTTATDGDNVEQVFYDVQNIIVKVNLARGGLV